MRGMKRLAFAFLLTTTLSAQPAGTVDSHVAAAKALAATSPTPLFNLCSAEQASRAQPRRGGQPPARGGAQQPARGQQAPPDRSQWGREPMKVFDNLYYVGEREYSAWAVTTSAGIIIIDPIYDYSVEEQVVGGLKKLGLDPAQIKYVVVSHAHRDHAGGAWYLQERFGARVLLSGPDWDMLENNKQSWPKPKRDMVVKDRQQLTLGDTTLTFVHTFGHTPGTMSTILPVKDNGKPHVAALWGGTGFNFTLTPERPGSYWFDSYIASAQAFREAAAKAGADVFLSNHPSWDDSNDKMARLAKRRAGDPHPYVVGAKAVQSYFTIAEHCARAGKARLAVASSQ
jgi:metallo-beta-lactamase class B